MSDLPIYQEPDTLATKKILVITVIACVIFAVGILWAALILRARTRDLQPNGAPPIPKQIGQKEIGMVNQFLFAEDPEILRMQEQERRRLDSFGWVDRKKRLVHIPIDLAMDLVAKANAMEREQ